MLRRCQVILASARGQHATTIGENLGCDDETVRRVIKSFHAHGLSAQEAKSRRPHRIQAAFSKQEADQLKELLHKSPRAYGQDTSVWTQEMVAEVSFAEGLTWERVSDETIRATLERLGCAGKVPSSGLPVRIRNTSENKTPRPVDPSDQQPS